MIPAFCAECGSKNLVAFEGESIALFNGEPLTNLDGARCADCGEVYLADASHDRYCDASDALVHAARADTGAMLRKVRKRLGLSQVQAARLTGGGPNAFSRYELGKAAPMPAVINLFRLLDRHPELLDELR